MCKYNKIDTFPEGAGRFTWIVKNMPYDEELYDDVTDTEEIKWFEQKRVSVALIWHKRFLVIDEQLDTGEGKYSLYSDFEDMAEEDSVPPKIVRTVAESLGIDYDKFCQEHSN